jgi:hypothetical protein
MFNNSELKYIQKFLHDREENLQKQNEEIEHRENMDKKYKDILLKTHGQNYFKTKSWEKKVEIEFNKLIKVQDKVHAILDLQ